MKGTDKFLAAIVLGVLLLVIVSVVLVITRPPPSYKEDNSAENVAYNYLLALQEHNYVRAYGYLSPSLSGYPPSVERFISNLRNAPFPADEGFPPEDGSVSLEIASSRAAVSNIESVEVRVRSTQFMGGGLFGPSQHSSLFLMDLQRENGTWKIVRSDRYFVPCWTRAAGCQ